MNITVIGCGRWGSLITWYLDHIGHRVTLYGRAASPRMQAFLTTRQNDLLTLPESVALSTALDAALESAETVIISIGSQSLRSLLGQSELQALRSRTVVLCMKGLEMGTGARLSQIAAELLHPSNTVAVWLGPGHVQEFYRGIPNCIGNEVGAAAKNVVGIAAGFLDGFEMSSLKGALMSRGTREVARLIKAMGGSELSAYGLCHLGDYEATVFSPYSHNRQFGESFVRGQDYHQLAEGYYTVKALMLLGQRYGVELPICKAVHDILYEQAVPRDVLAGLLRRGLTEEFYD